MLRLKSAFQCLSLSSRQLAQEIGIGKVVNLVSNDASRFDSVLTFFHFLWVAPMQAVACTVILYYTLGPASLLALMLPVVYPPVQGVPLIRILTSNIYTNLFLSIEQR